MLSDDQVRAIHTASLDILNKTGIVMDHEGANEILVQNGATCDGFTPTLPLLYPYFTPTVPYCTPTLPLLYPYFGAI